MKLKALAVIVLAVLSAFVSPARAVECDQLSSSPGMGLCVPRYGTDGDQWGQAIIDAFTTINSSAAISSTQATNTTQWLKVQRISGIDSGTPGVRLSSSVYQDAGFYFTTNSSASFQASGAGTYSVTTSSGINVQAGMVVAPGGVVAPLHGNATTASALDHNPTDCTGSDFVNGIAADGTLSCAAPPVGTGETNTYTSSKTFTGAVEAASVKTSSLTVGGYDVLGAWYTWTPTLTGCTSPTITLARYTVIGKSLYYSFDVNCTGSAASFGISFPKGAHDANSAVAIWLADNGTYQAAPGVCYADSIGATTWSCYKGNAGTAFTASGNRRAAGTGVFEIQ